MKRSILASIMVILSLSLLGCGHDHGNSRQLFSTSIISDPGFDGDIALDSAGTAFTITQGMTLISPPVQSVFAGIDPTSFTEYRTFLDFPLTGTDGVPGDAIIDSANLDIVISSIDPHPLTGNIPIRIDLINIQSATLGESDYYRDTQPALKTTTIEPPVSDSDFGQHVSVDVTSLMREAQRLGLANFQIRIMEDLGNVSPGIIEINDTTGANRTDLAPLLQVNYF
jgi:hypothetical protein